MSIKPIELQTLLKQMDSVAKETMKEEKKRHNEKVSKDKTLRSKREDIIVEVGKTEVENTIKDEARQEPSTSGGAEPKKRRPSEGPGRPSRPPTQEPYKGNFLNITE